MSYRGLTSARSAMMRNQSLHSTPLSIYYKVQSVLFSYSYRHGHNAGQRSTSHLIQHRKGSNTSQHHSTMAEFPPPPLKKIAEEVAAVLRERKETIAVAETAAGGLISAALLSTPGASKFYKGGLSEYHYPKHSYSVDQTLSPFKGKHTCVQLGSNVYHERITPSCVGVFTVKYG